MDDIIGISLFICVPLLFGFLAWKLGNNYEKRVKMIQEINENLRKTIEIRTKQD